MALDWWVRLLRHLMARLCGGTRARIASGSLHQIAVPCLGLNFEGLQNGSILAAPHRSSVVEVDFLLSPRSLSILVALAVGFGFGLLLFVAFLVCACRPGVRARSRVFYFRDARNLCSSPGRPGLFSILCFPLRSSCGLVARACGLGPVFCLFSRRS